MNRAEKQMAMEALWTDLTADSDKFESPAWHADALRDAEQQVADGTATFSDWDTAMARLRRKAAGFI